MKTHPVNYSLAAMCQCFNVSRSGDYAWLQRKPSQRLQQRQLLDEQVKNLFHKHKQGYGAERLQRKMPKENGQPYDLKTIAASLRRQSLVAKAARKFKTTTNSKHNLPVFDNLLQQSFSASAPNQKWVSAIQEGTGVYHEQAALALSDAGVTVSIVNPAQVKDFGRSLGAHQNRWGSIAGY